MKKIICILAIVAFITGCGSNKFLEKKASKDEITNEIQIRDRIAFLPNENEPFTGKFEEYYSSVQKEHETTYLHGKQNGLSTWWYNTGQKWIEDHYIDGSKNGLSTRWYENGQKWIEENYLDGKKNGLSAMWYENGQKRFEINYLHGKKIGLSTWWHETGRKNVKQTTRTVI
jgi:antitoxin component YwqK of YwqJK toxin-antitoxin module